MIGKFLQITGVLLIVTSCTTRLHASENRPQIQQVPVSPKVYLKCTLEVESSKVGAQDIITFAVTVKNITTSTIPKDTAIHWSVNAGTEGLIKLQNSLSPGSSTRQPVLVHGGCPYKPQAWYHPTHQDTASVPQIQVPPMGPVYLECTLKMGLQGPAVFFAVTIKNNTGATIPKDATLYWSLNPSTKGSFKLKNALLPNASVDEKLQTMPPSNSSPKAWYLK